MALYFGTTTHGVILGIKTAFMPVSHSIRYKKLIPDLDYIHAKFQTELTSILSVVLISQTAVL